MLKMLAIYVRVRCGIPVVLMGECGCGKTMSISEYTNPRSGPFSIPKAGPAYPCLALGCSDRSGLQSASSPNVVPVSNQATCAPGWGPVSWYWTSMEAQANLISSTSSTRQRPSWRQVRMTSKLAVPRTALHCKSPFRELGLSIALT